MPIINEFRIGLMTDKTPNLSDYYMPDKWNEALEGIDKFRKQLSHNCTR